MGSSGCDGASNSSATCGYGGEGAGRGETPPTCIPSENADAVGNDCGVFVDPEAPAGGMGTKENPVGTMGEAVGRLGADRSRIYACAAEFAEEVRLPGGTELYGGLECTKGWGYVGDRTKTTLRAPGAGKVALRLEGGKGTRVSDVQAVALDAQGAGESSIAVIAHEVEAEITGCAFEAGQGMDGAAGEGYPSVAPAGETGLDGQDACTANGVHGGDSVVTRCGVMESISGPGGTGSTIAGGSGSPGAPLGTMNGGAGEGASNCTPGTQGEKGKAGVGGAGAIELGTLAKTGYVGTAGRDGRRGGPGQGGGGGGGAKGGSGALLCAGATTGGAAGESGGSGGCGGAGGRGGTAGGSSIALVSVRSSLAFTGVTLRAGGGGQGGDGGPGQYGGPGGFPGAGGGMPAGTTNLKLGCSGGPGGKGGMGGQGGGGRGGHSVGIAYRGEAPSTEGVTFVKGTAGGGGVGADAGGNGAPGEQRDVQEFE